MYQKTPSWRVLMLTLLLLQSFLVWETARAHEIDDDDLELPCTDEASKCGHWSSLGECDANPKYMHQKCRKSCKLCEEQLKLSTSEHHLGGDLGVPQDLIFEDGTRPEDIIYLLAKARNYMKFVVSKNMGPGVVARCKNQKEDCGYWALDQECDSNTECK
jgi:hypothetical protein